MPRSVPLPPAGWTRCCTCRRRRPARGHAAAGQADRLHPRLRPRRRRGPGRHLVRPPPRRTRPPPGTAPPRRQQTRLPLWLGVGGTPASAERAERLGLPMVLGLIGGDIRRSRPLVERYRTAGQAVGHAPDTLRLGLTSHFYVGKTFQGARENLYPYYREYLRPKTPGGRGWLIGPTNSRPSQARSAHS
ncbi:LLM class flavin-dependent oxidoreductase [Streptomyces gardneri]|uniref:LLM class flavin-dependent oxidoreductase n=1 Tax=Streptomyces gardneri TaxID=66892 RepID=UPI0033C40003